MRHVWSRPPIVLAPSQLTRFPGASQRPISSVLMMDLDGFLKEIEAMPVQNLSIEALSTLSTHFSWDDSTGKSFWSRVWGSSSFQTFDFDRHSSKIWDVTKKDPKSLGRCRKGSIKVPQNLRWSAFLPKPRSDWMDQQISLGGLGGTSVPLAKSKRRRAGRCPPRKGKNHSQFAGPSPCRRRGSDSDGARPEQADPVVANALQSVEDDPLALESIESMKKSTPCPSLHQISQRTPQPRGKSWRRPETTTTVRGPTE
ncbi:hypothetical protein GE21DRAFT_1290966 [Neurospora crassa]|nr:hypothetical protein GE21DRAFT_1290966 [Neurospora crassa]